MAVLVALGSGKMLSSLAELGSMRLAGTMLPGKQPELLVALQASPVCGSRTGISCPFVFRLCEKSPFRSSAVGTVKLLIGFGDWLGRYSCEKKKNSFCLPLLKWPG